MKVIGKHKLRENSLIRSRPGIPDVKRISCAQLAGALTEFAKRYLRGLAEVFGPPDVMSGAIGVSPKQLGYALRITVDRLSCGEPVAIYITEWDDEMNIRIEGAGLEDRDAVEDVISAWHLAGFKLQSRTLVLHFSIPLEKALHLVVRDDSSTAFNFMLKSGYFYEN